MKGVIFNLLEQIVTDELGAETWDALLEKSKLDGAYTSLGSYPDNDLFKIVAAAAEALGKPPQEIVRWTGIKALPLLAQRYPNFFNPHKTTRTFVLTLNDIIHPEVRKLYPGADVPEFGFDTRDPHVLRMSYQSARKMCAFAEGLITGSAIHFGETTNIHQTKCMHRGDSECLFEIRTTPGVTP
jgi:hypothetical protein